MITSRFYKIMIPKWKVTNMNEAFFINVVDRPTEEQLKKRGNVSG
jgi:hypothetical protein